MERNPIRDDGEGWEGPAPTPEAAGRPVGRPLAEFDLAPYGPLVEDEARHRSTRFFYGLGAVLFLAILAAAVLGSPFDQFAGTSLEALPFAGLALLAYLGRTRPGALALAALWHFGLLLLAGAFIPLAVLALALARADLGSGKSDSIARLPPGAWLQVGMVWTICLLGVLAAAACLLPAVRKMAAQRLPLDRRSPVHAFALSLVVGLTVMLLGPLVVDGGRPLFLEWIRVDPTFAEELAKQDLLLSMVFGLVWIVPGTMMAVGYPVARTAREALVRLGLVVPTLRQVMGALVLAALLVGAGLALDWLIGGVWGVMGWPKTDEEAVSKLFAAAISPLGAVVIGVTAGLGEELAIRGALQPRLGIWLSNLFFTSVHALQYGFDGLLSVFLVGLVLGLVRQRTNTTTSCIVHGVYDFILVMGAVYFG